MWKYSISDMLPCSIIIPGSIRSIRPKYYFDDCLEGVYDNCIVLARTFGASMATCSKYNRPGLSIRGHDNTINHFCMAWWVDCESCRHYRKPD